MAARVVIAKIFLRAVRFFINCCISRSFRRCLYAPTDGGCTLLNRLFSHLHRVNDVVCTPLFHLCTRLLCSSWSSDSDDDPWCSRCRRSFRTERALEQHRELSSSHHICAEDCGFDGESQEELHEHWEETECFYLCRGCRVGYRPWWNYQQHLHDNNACDTCQKHFDNHINLQMVPHPCRDVISTKPANRTAPNITPACEPRVLGLLPPIFNNVRHADSSRSRQLHLRDQQTSSEQDGGTLLPVEEVR